MTLWKQDRHLVPYKISASLTSGRRPTFLFIPCWLRGKFNWIAAFITGRPRKVLWAILFGENYNSWSRQICDIARILYWYVPGDTISLMNLIISARGHSYSLWSFLGRLSTANASQWFLAVIREHYHYTALVSLMYAAKDNRLRYGVTIFKLFLFHFRFSLEPSWNYCLI